MSSRSQSSSELPRLHPANAAGVQPSRHNDNPGNRTKNGFRTAPLRDDLLGNSALHSTGYHEEFQQETMRDRQSQKRRLQSWQDDYSAHDAHDAPGHISVPTAKRGRLIEAPLSHRKGAKHTAVACTACRTAKQRCIVLPCNPCQLSGTKECRHSACERCKKAQVSLQRRRKKDQAVCEWPDSIKPSDKSVVQTDNDVDTLVTGVRDFRPSETLQNIVRESAALPSLASEARSPLVHSEDSRYPSFPPPSQEQQYAPDLVRAERDEQHDSVFEAQPPLDQEEQSFQQVQADPMDHAHEESGYNSDGNQGTDEGSSYDSNTDSWPETPLITCICNKAKLARLLYKKFAALAPSEKQIFPPLDDLLDLPTIRKLIQSKTLMMAPAFESATPALDREIEDFQARMRRSLVLPSPWATRISSIHDKAPSLHAGFKQILEHTSVQYYSDVIIWILIGAAGMDAKSATVEDLDALGDQFQWNRPRLGIETGTWRQAYHAMSKLDRSSIYSMYERVRLDCSDVIMRILIGAAGMDEKSATVEDLNALGDRFQWSRPHLGIETGTWRQAYHAISQLDRSFIYSMYGRVRLSHF